MNRFKLTKTELSWILYDIGNSAFTMMVSTLIPIYFNFLGEKAGISSTDYLAFCCYTDCGGDCTGIRYHGGPEKL